MKRLFLLFSFVFPLNLFSQTLSAPPWPIVSDYGPRILKGAYNWHWGIDYDGEAWDPVSAVEGGSIHTVLANTSGGHVVGITGSSGYWFYLHLFNNDFPSISPDNRYELRKAILENPDDHTTTPEPINIIIFWSDRANNYAERILSSQDNLWVQTGNPDVPYIYNVDGSTWAKTQSGVNQGEVIAPMGTSGSVGSHLDLRLRSPMQNTSFTPPYDINPLYYIAHPPDALPAATVLKPETAEEINEPEVSDYGFKAEVNSAGGWDLDKVSFRIYQDKREDRSMDLGTSGLPTFRYGGRPGEGRSGIVYSSDGEATGVQPFLIDNDSLGHDRFIFRQNLAELNLLEGEHSFVVKLKDVNGNPSEAVLTDFKVITHGPKVSHLNFEGTPKYICEDASCADAANPRLVYWSPASFKFEDISGLKGADIYEGNFGDLLHSKTFSDAKTAQASFPLQESLPYTMTARDTLGLNTTAYLFTDAYRPYLKTASITRGDPLYYKEWTYDGSLLKCPGPEPDRALTTGYYTIHLEFSEPVVNPNLMIGEYKTLPLRSNEPAGEQKNFTAKLNIKEATPIEDGVHTAYITARDLAGNALLALDQETEINPATRLTRNADGVMQGTGGIDSSVEFTIDREPPIVGIKNVGEASGKIEKRIHILRNEFNLYMRDETSGIEKIRIWDETNNIRVYEKTFDPPVKDFATPVSLKPGDYTARVLDEAGNETSMPYRAFPDAMLTVSTANSSAGIDYDAFSASVDVRAWAPGGIITLDMADSEYGTHKILTKPPNPVEHIFNIGGYTDDYHYKPRTYITSVLGENMQMKYGFFSLMFAHSEEYRNATTFGEPLTSDYESPVIDLKSGDTPMIGGKISVSAKGDKWWQSGRGGYGWRSFPGGAKALTYTWQPIGRIKVVVKTWNEGGENYAAHTVTDRMTYLAARSEAPSGSVCENYPGALDEGVPTTCHFCYCYIENAGEVFENAGRYVQTRITLTRTPAEAVLPINCGETALDENGVLYCADSMDMAPTVLVAGPGIHGVQLRWHEGETIYGALLAGGSFKFDLPHGAVLTFHDITKPGLLRFLYAGAGDYPGYKNNDNWSWNFEVENAEFDSVDFTTPYDPAGLNEWQENNQKIFRISDTGRYLPLPTKIDKVNKTLTARVNSFSSLMAATPRHAAPVKVQSEALVGGLPEMEFTSDDASAGQSVLEEGAPEREALLNLIASRGGILAGNIYNLTADNEEFDPPGILKMRYDENILAEKGINERSMAIYGASAGGSAVKFSRALIDPEKNEIITEIPDLYPYFAVIGSSAPPGPMADLTPPVSEMAVLGEQFSGPEGGFYINAKSSMILTAQDPEIYGEETSLVKEIYYTVDDAMNSLNRLVYEKPLILTEGKRDIYHAAVDNAGNVEAVKSTAVYVDGTAPVTAFEAGGVAYASGQTAYISESDSITLTAVDPVSNNVASGVKFTGLLIDQTLESCGQIGEPNSSYPQGSCENPVYAGPFSLSPGTHTVYYMSYDNVMNEEAIKSAYMEVKPEIIAKNPAEHPYFKFVSKFGRHGNLPGEFNSPVDVDVDDKKNIYVLDEKNYRVQKFSPGNEFLKAWDIPFIFIESSYGINFCVNEQGGIYVAAENRILKYDTEGNLLYEISGFLGDVWIWFMFDVACGSHGDFYVSGSFGNVLHFNSHGQYLGKFGVGDHSGFKGIASDSNNGIYISYSDEHKIRKFDLSGNLLLEWGDYGNESSELYMPTRLDTDSFDNVYVRDSGNKRISVFTSSGDFITTFGQASLPEFSGIQGGGGIGIDRKTGRVFVSDSKASEIEVFDLDFSSPTVPIIISPTTFSAVYSARPRFFGKGKPGQQVEISEHNLPIGDAIVNQDEWFFLEPANDLTYGMHDFSVKAIDYKGYESSKTTVGVELRPLSETKFSSPADIETGIINTFGIVADDFNFDGLLTF